MTAQDFGSIWATRVPGDRRIVVVDRFPLIRSTIANLLGRRQVAEVVGAADSLGRALAVCREQCPDILVTDVDLADRDRKSVV